MNGPEILKILRDQFEAELRQHAPPEPQPLTVTPWVAMSLLQKAIRRGEAEWAYKATATLLRDDSNKLWRRISVIAFEDVGMGDVESVGIVTAALHSKQHLSLHGKDWELASFLVSRLVNAAKCRAADDLIMIAERHPGFSLERSELTDALRRDLMHIIVSSTSPLPVRAIALWNAVGTTRCRSDFLPPRSGRPQDVFDALCETSLPHSVVEIAREGFQQTRQILCPFLALLSGLALSEPRSVEDDAFPPVVMCGSVPSWALDMFTREGRQALKRFLAADCETARWVRTHIPASQQIEFLGYILFAVESGLLKRRLRWKIGDDLRRLAEVESQGPHCPDATEILRLMRADIDLLNEVRGHVL